MILPGIAQSVKLITEKGCARICEHAFDFAEDGPQARHCVHKANIMKLTDGPMLEVFRRTA